MNTIQEKIATELKDAMRAKDQVAMTALRALKSALLYVSVAPGAQAEISEADALAVVRKQIKQRRDSVDQFTAGNRQDLADKELAEIAVLEKFLPVAMTEEEVLALVDTVIAELGATSKKQMGEVMKVLQERTAGRAEGKVLSKAVGAKLQ